MRHLGVCWKTCRCACRSYHASPAKSLLSESLPHMQVKYLDNISDADIPGLEIPTGVPLIYELDDNLKPIKHYYAG